jgi:acyl carrier protein
MTGGLPPVWQVTDTTYDLDSVDSIRGRTLNSDAQVSADIAARVLHVLRPHLGLLGDDQPIPPDVRLSTLGLDSVAAIQLVLDLEDEFGVTVPDDLLTTDLFADAGHLVAAVDRLVALTGRPLA